MLQSSTFRPSGSGTVNLSYRVMAFFFIAGLIMALALGSFLPTNTLSNNDGQSSKSLDTHSTRQTYSLAYGIPGSTLGGSLENPRVPRVLTLELGGSSPFKVVSPTKILHETSYSLPSPSQTPNLNLEEAPPRHSSFSLSTCNLSHQNSSFGNATIKGCRISFRRSKVPKSGLPMIFLVGFLLTMAVLFSILPLLLVVAFRVKQKVMTRRFPFVSDICEELESIVPGFLLRNGPFQMDYDWGARVVPPLGYAILTESGTTCSVDPGPSRQLSEEEYKNRSKYGTPVQPLAVPRSPLTSCLAGTRSENSQSTPPRQVTFSDENKVIIFPSVNFTRERNIRRRLSRQRLNCTVAAVNDPDKDNVFSSTGKRHSLG